MVLNKWSRVFSLAPDLELMARPGLSDDRSADTDERHSKFKFILTNRQRVALGLALVLGSFVIAVCLSDHDSKDKELGQVDTEARFIIGRNPDSPAKTMQGNAGLDPSQVHEAISTVTCERLYES